MSKKKVWSDDTPVRIRPKRRCAALDQDGIQCDEPAEFRTVYFGDDEVEGKDGWVLVELCQFHGKRAHNTWEGNLPYKTWAKLKKAGKIRFVSR